MLYSVNGSLLALEPLNTEMGEVNRCTEAAASALGPNPERAWDFRASAPSATARAASKRGWLACARRRQSSNDQRGLVWPMSADAITTNNIEEGRPAIHS